jgi:hypothetical protein
MGSWIDRDDREPASFPGIVVLPDGRRFPVTITNVSIAGCQVEGRETMPIGAQIHLHVGREELAADVRWAIDGKGGLRFCDS